MRACELSAAAALVGFASVAVASTQLQERDIVRCSTTQDCQGSGVYLPPNSVPSCSPRRTCTYACNDGYLSTGGGCLATATPSQASSKQTTQAAPSITTAAGTTTPQSLRTMVGSPLAATVGSSATIRASGAFSTDLDRVVLGVPVPETSPTPTPTTTKTTTTTTTTTTTSAHPTGTQCVVNADCDNSIPADSHNTCTWGFCGWGCNSGYKLGFNGGGCVPIYTASLAAPTRPAATPRLLRSYAGSSFFDRWFFYNDTDPTHGMVNYVGRNYANKAGLTYITSSGSAVLSIDRKSKLAPGVYRESVRIMSTDTYDAGSLIIIDMKHVPYGCSTWPAFWTFNWPWPSYGEIDVYEGVNSRFFNQMTLHTENGCTRSGSQTGNVQWASPNCYAYSGGDNGCTVFDYDPSSYGAGFNAAGGGVFALQIAETGVSIWRWQRSQIPRDVQSGNPRPYTWGTPVAEWDGATCDTRTFIQKQMLTFDITTCGDWAGIDGVFQRGDLSGSCYPQYANCAAAVQDPAAFSEAYFEVNYIRVFQV
ncbi:hypothetical protein JCM8115_000081 [Rhodotorula mucilaginosa]